MTVQEQKDKIEKLPEIMIHKYSNNGKCNLSESVKIEDKDYFLAYTINQDKNKDYFVSPPYIQEDTRIIKPSEPYGYEPYIFKTVNEPNLTYLQKAKNLSIDDLYQQVKTQVKLYNDIDRYAVSLVSAYIISSYFQDRLPTTPYLQIVGDNGTGKSSLGDTYKSLGYRAVKVSSTTEAFWFRVCGTQESGQVTIIAEEIDRLDEKNEVMSLLKEGYQPNARVPRMTNDNSKMEFFYPYCQKILIGEKSPSENKAKGVTDRSFKIKTYKGLPTYNIKETMNPQGNKKRQKRLDDINELRNTALCYKLTHYNIPLIEVDVGLDGRDEELCKPILQIFYTLGATQETMKELEDTFQYFLDLKNKRKNTSREAILCPIVQKVVKESGNVIQSSVFWKEVTDILIEQKEGNLDLNNSNMFEGSNFGLYINTLTSICCDKFGVESEHSYKGSVITFDVEFLNKVAKTYDNNKGIKTVPIEPDTPDTFDTHSEEGSECVSNNKDKIYTNPETLIKNSQESESKDKDKDMTHSTPSIQGASGASVRQDYPDKCYYCDAQFSDITKEIYQSHVLNEHPTKLCYPNKASLQRDNIEPQGMKWE